MRALNVLESLLILPRMAIRMHRTSANDVKHEQRPVKVVRAFEEGAADDQTRVCIVRCVYKGAKAGEDKGKVVPMREK